jgi:phosphatidylinositol-3-phosphatase
MRLLPFAAAVLSAVLLLGSGRPGVAATERPAPAATGGPSAPCGTETRRPRRWKHVIWLWMENASYEQIVGSSSARYLTHLARQCGLATNYHAITHPSLPNYIAATSGSDWGIGDDNPPGSHPLARASIFGELTAAGMTWRSYDESMPSNCDRSSSGGYAVKHNPAAYYTGIRKQCATWDVPMGSTASGPFLSDLRGDTLPSFSFVTPNLCHDMHNCSPAVGDAWLQRWTAKLVGSSAYRSGTTVLIVTFDEGSGTSNRVATLVVSPTTPPGTRSATRFDHYSLLKTTEQLLGIRTHLAHAGDASTNSMRPGFHL